VDTIGHRYDYIWYLDSDATVSPLHFNLSIEQKLASWESESILRNSDVSDSSSLGSAAVNRGQYSHPGGVDYGNKRVTQAALVFFNNHPWRDGMALHIYIFNFIIYIVIWTKYTKLRSIHKV